MIARAFKLSSLLWTVAYLALVCLVVMEAEAPAYADSAGGLPQRVTTLEGSQVGVQRSQTPIVAGDLIYDATDNSTCTVGGVLEPSYTELIRSLGLRSGTRWLFTAGHCGRVGDSIYTSVGHVYLGRVDSQHHDGHPTDDNHDFMTILVPPVLSGTNFLCPPASGIPQCQGGNLRFTPRAMSGVANCGESDISLHNTSRSISGVATQVPSITRVSACGGASGFWRAGDLIGAPPSGTPLHGTVDTNVAPAMRDGDSGGPLYTRLGDNTYRLIGILSAERPRPDGRYMIDRFVTVNDEIRQTGHLFVSN